MPIHTVSATDLESTVAELERTERIIQVVAAGEGAYHVVTEAKPSKRKSPGESETRS